MIRDRYPRDKAAGVLGYVTMTMATAVAPFVGAFLEEWWGRRAGFVLMTILGVLLTASSVRFAQETSAAGGAMPSFEHLFTVYGTIVRTARFRRFGGYSICILASYYAFMAGAPYIVIVLFDQPPSRFGFYYIFAGGAYITGNYLASRLSERLGAEAMTKMGGMIAAMAGFALIAFAAVDLRHPLAIFFPIAVSFVGSGLSQPSAMMSAIDAVPQNIGAGAGLLGALQLVAGSVASIIVGATQSGCTMAFATVCGGFLVLALGILLGVRAQHG